MSEPLVCLKELTVEFRADRGFKKRSVVAVAPTSLDIAKGELLAIVGESGSGKTTLGRAILRLLPSARGRISFDGMDITALRNKGLLDIRPRMQMIFQDPYTSLNPRKTIGRILGEVLARVGVPRDARRARTEHLLEQVGLDGSAFNRYPAAFSGGQRQRIAIARALATNPELIVADEPVSALDVSVQAQVVNLLLDLKDSRSLTLVFISHDMGVVSAIADRVAVMYFGRIVEIGSPAEITQAPAHPYTALINSNVPHPNVASARAMIEAASNAEEAELPSLFNPPKGCVFRGRCKHASGLCEQTEPALVELAPGRNVACHHPLVASKEKTHDH